MASEQYQILLGTAAVKPHRSATSSMRVTGMSLAVFLRVQVLQEGSTKPLAEHMTGQQFAWLQGHLGAMSAETRRASAPMLASFLAGCSEQGFKYSTEFYGCLVPFKEVGLHMHPRKLQKNLDQP